MSVFRLSVVLSHPIQYAAPLYAYLKRNPQLEITALYCTASRLRGGKDRGFGHAVTWDVDLLDGYRSVFLGRRAKTRSVGGFWSLVCPELVGEITRARYDAVLVHGQQFAAYVLAFAVAKLKGIPVLTRGETHLGLARPPVRRLIRDRLLSIQYSFVDRFLAIGTANRQYYRAISVPDSRIFDVPYAVDNQRFMRSAELTKAERSAYRSTFGVHDDRPVILYASKLMRRKHPDQLLRAAADLSTRGHHCNVVIAGSGEMESDLKALVSDLGLANVIFTGFINQSELPKLYAASDIFVLPAENEAWGLIVNEVMCAGLPVVVADGVGCVPDLVRDGVNGFTCKAGSAASLADALEGLVSDPELRQRMGAESRQIISDWGYEQCRQGVLAAVAGLKTASARV